MYGDKKREYNFYKTKVNNPYSYNNFVLLRNTKTIDEIINKSYYSHRKKEKKFDNYSINRENKTITILGKEYKYNAFSILETGIKIYNGHEIFIQYETNIKK